MVDLLRPEDLKTISNEADMAKAKEYAAILKKREDAQEQLKNAFLQREIHPEVRQRVNEAIRRAAEQGRHELRVLTFPASYCNDRGRRINNNEPDWPDSLEGFARRAYEYFDKEMSGLGYKLAAQVLDYPGGMPGDVGLFLRW